MLYITSYCSPNRSISGAVKDLFALGFRNIELTGGTDYVHYSEDELMKLRERYKLNFLIHNYFPPQKNESVLNLSSRDPHIRKQNFKFVKQAVSLARKMGQDMYSIHAGFPYDLSPIKDEDGVYKRSGSVCGQEGLYENIKRISESVLPSGFRLAVENSLYLAGGMFSPLSMPHEMLAFLSAFEKFDNVGLLIDFGHLNIASHYLNFQKEKFLEELLTIYSHKIFEIHISRNNSHTDSHEVSTTKCFEVDFIRKHGKKINGVPIVFEWQDKLSRETFESYLEISRFLNL